MVRNIEENLFCIKSYAGNRYFIESETMDELAEYIAERELKGYSVASVTQICIDGSTPRIAIKSNKAYKAIVKG